MQYIGAFPFNTQFINIMQSGQETTQLCVSALTCLFVPVLDSVADGSSYIGQLFSELRVRNTACVSNVSCKQTAVILATGHTTYLKQRKHFH